MDGKGNKRRLDLIALSAVATWKSKEMRSEQRWECNWLGNLRKTPSFLAVLSLLGSLTVHKSFVEKFPARESEERPAKFQADFPQ